VKQAKEKPTNKQFSLSSAAIGAVIILILGGVVTLFTDSYSQDKAAKVAAIQSFEDVAYTLEPIGEEYFKAKASQDPILIAQKKEILLTNISEQVAAAKKLTRYFDDDEVIYQYTESVLQLRRTVMQDAPLEDMKPYWQATHDVLVSRDNVANTKS